MYDLRTGFSIELADITEQTFAECQKNGIYSIDPGLSKRFSTDAYAKILTVVRKMAERYGICIECIHLPYGPGWDISETFEPLRKAAVEGHKEIMKVCREVCPPNYFVLHPSTEPILPEKRATHFGNAQESLSALESGQLLVENLPRFCLANTADELLELIRPFPQLRICCDVNHLLQETPQSALGKFGKLVKHLHISDNDGVNERHLLPGDGVIAWGEVIDTLEQIGYSGVFNYEVRKYSAAEIIENKNRLFAGVFDLNNFSSMGRQYGT